MSGEALRKVQPGQRLRIPASAYNAFIDAAQDLQDRRHDSRGVHPPTFRDESGLVLVLNDSGVALDRFSVVTMSGVVIAPADNLVDFQAGAIFYVTKPVAGRPIVVLQEPLAAGKYGKALVFGVTPVYLTVSSDAHVCADLEAGEAGHLVSAATGPARILWTLSTSPGSGSGSGSGSGAGEWGIVAIGQDVPAVAAAIVPVKLTAKTNDSTYTGDVYANGTDLAASQTGATIRVEGLAANEVLPFGVVFHATLQSWLTIGGSGRTSYLTLIDVPRFV